MTLKDKFLDQIQEKLVDVRISVALLAEELEKKYQIELEERDRRILLLEESLQRLQTPENGSGEE